jgi:cytochrome c oxidase assembly factor CtaG
MVFLVVGLVSPLCRLAATLAWAHMVQHLILVALAPPFLVLGAGPLRTLFRGQAGSTRSRAAVHPAIAATIYGLSIWFWHVPACYQASLSSSAVHLLMYGTLLLAGLLFWSSVIGSIRPHRQSSVLAVVILLITLLHTGLLGALLTFSPSPWYPLMQGGALAWGLAALEDQQLAGLIMWIPMGFIYLAAALVLAATSLDQLGRPRLAGAPLGR